MQYSAAASPLHCSLMDEKHWLSFLVAWKRVRVRQLRGNQQVPGSKEAPLIGRLLPPSGVFPANQMHNTSSDFSREPLGPPLIWCMRCGAVRGKKIENPLCRHLIWSCL